jgi:DNA-3-methyladenine glycosylase II
MGLFGVECCVSQALADLDPTIAGLIAKHGPCPIPTRENQSAYQSLFRAIVYQQLSGKAAGTILSRVLSLCGDPENAPAPDHFLKQSDEDLRACGLSRQKLAALRDLSQKRLDGVVPDSAEIDHLPDEDIISRLTAVRGVGQWTVEMYLMFTLGRPDVWPVDDLGVRKGWTLAHKLPEMPKPKAFKTMADHLRPYRTQVAWYCWRECDTVTPDA